MERVRRFARMRREATNERGFVLVWMVIVVGLLLGVAAFAVDLVHAYVEADRVQKAADSAALAGAVEIPQDVTGSFAKTRAHELADNNGFQNGVNGATVDPEITGPNEMTVEVKETFPTFFARFMGFDTLTVRRKAVAQYDPPLQMGSAQNHLGDVPECPPTVPPTVPAPAADSCVVPTGSPPIQHLWAQILGPDTPKRAGNPYTVTGCDGGTDGCHSGSGANREYDPNGEFFLVKNDQPGPLDIWIYDGGFVNTGPDCGDVVDHWAADPAYNNLLDPQGAGGVIPHYADKSYCTGDTLGVNGPTPASTTFEMRGPDSSGVDDNDPTNNPVINQGGCATTTIAGKGHPNDAYDDPSTRPFFHQWYHLCSVGAAAGREYEVHVTSPNGYGTNGFSILARHGNVPGNLLNVYTKGRLPLIAVNPGSAATSTFYVARVQPSNHDRTLSLDFFDLGDQTNNAEALGTLSVKTLGVTSPAGGFTNCKYTSPQGTPPEGGPGDDFAPWDATANMVTSSNCSVRWDRTTWNKQWVTLQIDIPGRLQGNGNPNPNGYDCDFTDPQACWIQISLRPDSGATWDATTWSASMAGSPVRLVG
jgi:hypothetical protein